MSGPRGFMFLPIYNYPNGMKLYSFCLILPNLPKLHVCIGRYECNLLLVNKIFRKYSLCFVFSKREFKFWI